MTSTPSTPSDRSFPISGTWFTGRKRGSAEHRTYKDSFRLKRAKASGLRKRSSTDARTWNPPKVRRNKHRPTAKRTVITLSSGNSLGTKEQDSTSPKSPTLSSKERTCALSLSAIRQLFYDTEAASSDADSIIDQSDQVHLKSKSFGAKRVQAKPEESGSMLTTISCGSTQELGRGLTASTAISLCSSTTSMVHGSSSRIY